MQLLCRWWKISVGRFSVSTWWSLYLLKRQWANTKEEISISSQLWKTWDNKNIHRDCLDSSFREKTVGCWSVSVLLSHTGYLQRADCSLGGLLADSQCDVESIPHCPLLPWRLCQSWVSPAPSSDPQHYMPHQLWSPICCWCCFSHLVWWVPRVIWWQSSVPASSWPALFFHAKIVNNGQTELNLLWISHQAR